MPEMSLQQIQALLIAEVAAILAIDPSAVTADAPLHSLGMTSMAFVELLVAIEKTFDLRLMETDLTRADFQAIGPLAARIHEMM